MAPTNSKVVRQASLFDDMASSESKHLPKPPSEPSAVQSVSELTLQLKGAIEPRFSRVLVRGEVSGFRGANPRGHLYFAIKDAHASIDVKMWQGTAKSLKFALRDGLSVIVEGAINIYEPQGRYSLIAQKIDPDGVGALALAFEQLKAKLMADGLIGPKRTKPQRPIPFLPQRIGVVTSLHGAALKDFLKVLFRRHPRLSVLVADARVQGEAAAAEVCRALKALAQTDVDLIVVTRGGGSIEDLWTFNEEAVVRAIFNCPVAVVSAIGHEIDTTLADFVADVRAPTPSAAAELVAPVLADLELALATHRSRLSRAMQHEVKVRQHALSVLRADLGDPRRNLTREQLRLGVIVDSLVAAWRRALKEATLRLNALNVRLSRVRPEAQLQNQKRALTAMQHRLADVMRKRLHFEQQRATALSNSLHRSTPGQRIARARDVVSFLARRASVAIETRQKAERIHLVALTEKLDAYSPLKVLGRGYAIAKRTGDQHIVRYGTDARPGDSLAIRVIDAEILATVTQVKALEK